MKEITRIHIAKVAYDIEVSAKNELEGYIAALERYAGDKELLDDIEIRITELLAERGVAAGGIISDDDVAAVRAQLGEPSDFAPEGEEAATHTTQEEPRRVYRDTDHAVLGGVLAGFGRFFGIEPLWVRLLFVMFLFASGGTALLLYGILWLIIPPARTAAEKLRMDGQPVTLASIKELAGSGERQSETTKTARRILSSGAGTLLLLSGIGFLMFTAAMVVRVLFNIGSFPMESFMRPVVGAPWWVMAAFALFTLAGLLLPVLCFILSAALFRQVWSKRIGTAAVAVIAAGLLAFTGGVGTIVYGRFEQEVEMQRSFHTSYVNLPANFAGVKNLSALADNSGIGVGNMNITISYTVSDTPRYEFNAPDSVRPEFIVSSNGLSATVKVTKTNDSIWQRGYLGSTELRVYGPALERIQTEPNSPSLRYYASQPQNTLAATVKGSGFDLSGAYGAVTLINEEGGTTAMSQATVGDLRVNNAGGRVEAGVVRSLAVTIPDACPAPSVPGVPDTEVRVQAVSSGDFIYNGASHPAKTIESSCGKVIIGS